MIVFPRSCCVYRGHPRLFRTFFSSLVHQLHGGALVCFLEDPSTKRSCPARVTPLETHSDTQRTMTRKQTISHPNDPGQGKGRFHEHTDCMTLRHCAAVSRGKYIQPSNPTHFQRVDITSKVTRMYTCAQTNRQRADCQKHHHATDRHNEGTDVFFSTLFFYLTSSAFCLNANLKQLTIGSI